MKDRELALLVTRQVKIAGGFISFADFDTVMFDISYLTPFHWIAGWGLSRASRKRNRDKMCAFAACKYGFIEQVHNGYQLLKRTLDSGLQ